MIFTFLIIVHIIVCILLILLVLIQSDKGGGLAGAFGGMGGGVNTVFGGRGTANILTKATTWFAAGFMVICLALNLMVAHRSNDQVKTLLQKRAEQMAKTAPAAALPSGVEDPSVGGAPPGLPAPPQDEAPQQGQPAQQPAPAQ